MPSPQKKPNQKSVTSPQHSATLRKIMFLDKVSVARDREYQSRLSSYMEEQKAIHANLSPEEIEGLKEGFTRRYYRHEYNALAEFQAIQNEQESLEERRSLGTLKPNELERYKMNDFNLSLGPEGYAASKLFDNQVIKDLRQQFPKVEKELKAELRAVREEKFPDMPPQTGVRPATVELFNQRYPKLKSELNHKARQTNDNRAVREAGMAGLALLKWGSALANPSGYLLSKAIGGVLSSPTFKPMVGRIGNGIKMASNKTGLTGKLKKMMGTWSDVSVKRVAAGVAIGGAAGLLALGILEPENAQEIYANIKESVLDFVPNNDQTAYAYDNNPGSEFAFDNALSGESASPRENLPGEKMPPTEVSQPAVDVENSATPTEPDASPEKAPEKASPSTGEPAESKPTVEKTAPTEMSVAEQKATSGVPSNNHLESVPKETGVSMVEGGKYVVQSGDTLSEIVEQRLQESGRPYNYELIDEYVKQIAMNNSIDNPDLILSGQTIELPDIPKSEVAISSESVEEAKQQIASADPNKNTARTIAETQKNTPGLFPDPASAALSQCDQTRPELSVKNGEMNWRMSAKPS